MKNFINLTPHAINVLEGGKMLEIPASGIIARLEQKDKKVGVVNGIDCYQTVYGEITNLPAEKEDTIYIVSFLVLNKANRRDLVSPSQLLRDEIGKIIGCKGFTVKETEQ